MKTLTGNLTALFMSLSLSACGPQEQVSATLEEAPQTEEEIGHVADALSCGYGSTRQVQATPSSLDSKLAGASCGDELVLAAGTYGGSFTYAKACDGQKPVVIRSQNALGAVLKGTLTLRGSHVVVTGLKVSGGEIELRGKHARVTRNYITSPRSMSLSDGAVGNRIDHNEFRDTYGVNTEGDDSIAGGDIIFNLRTSDDVKVTGTRIDGNLFRGTKSSGIISGVSVYVGTYDLNSRFDFVYETSTLIEGNYWANWKKKAALEIKSSKTTFRNNVIDGQSFAKVLNRNGMRSVFSGNNIGGTGLNIYDKDNTLIGNRVAKEIRIFADGRVGTAAEAEAGKGLRLGAHNARIIGNQGKVVLGDNEGADDLSAVRNVLLEAHKGEVVKARGLVSGLIERASASVQVPAVASFTASAVGINSGNACQ